jgi:hypothetical protein
MSFVGTACPPPIDSKGRRALNLTNDCSIRHFERSEAESKSVMGKLVFVYLKQTQTFVAQSCFVE